MGFISEGHAEPLACQHFTSGRSFGQCESDMRFSSLVDMADHLLMYRDRTNLGEAHLEYVKLHGLAIDDQFLLQLDYNAARTIFL